MNRSHSHRSGNRSSASSRTARSFWIAALLASPLIVSACALTSKADLVTIRYFNPERAASPNADSTGAKAGAQDLRLGRVGSGPNLRERIAFRESAYEVGYYEGQRWTERPEIYLRRRLSRALFEESGFRRVITGFAPTLEVELLSFDELKLADKHLARIELKIVLIDDRGVIFEDSLTIDRPIASPSKDGKIEDVVRAMSEALDGAADAVTKKVQAAVSARAPVGTAPLSSAP